MVEGRYREEAHEWPKAVEIYSTLATMFPDSLDYGLRLAAAQTEGAKPKKALVTLERLRSLPPPLGKDPRISIESSTAWYSLGDFSQMEVALEDAVGKAQALGHQLLLASARSQQCFAWHFLGDQKKAIEACREAQQIYTAAGDRGGQANALRLLGDAFSESDVGSAITFYEKALAMEKETGNIWGQATVLNQLAILYSNRADHTAAKTSFEQVLKICRLLGKKVSATGMMINISSELAAQGKLGQARAMDEETFHAAEELGNKQIEGLVSDNIALIDQLRGELDSRTHIRAGPRPVGGSARQNSTYRVDQRNWRHRDVQGRVRGSTETL